MRTEYDLEMMVEMGFCSGIENYSRHISGRPPGSRPYTLIDFFPSDYLLVIDESHATIPQIGGMYAGDRSRKTVLVEYGFRLPSALDNRPLNFDEFQSMQGQTIYVSATPTDREMEWSKGRVVEQIVRPTGLIDPKGDGQTAEGPDRRSDRGGPQTGREEGARSGHHADQAHRGGIDRLPARHRHQCALPAQRD